MQENYLAKWLNNELSEAELTEFKNSDEYAAYERIVINANALEAPDFNADEALVALENKRALHNNKVVQLNPFKRFLKVAAAVAILLTGTYFYTSTLDQVVSTAYAQNKEIVLPDNSEVILNADSKITYSDKKWNDNRNINLEGEAFFKVAKGKRFTVATKAGNVTVLGTQFNVENRTDFFEVTCYEGLVSVSFNGKETKLPAGSSFVAINQEIVSHKVQNSTTPSWVNEESSFKSIPLRYVFDEFQRQHDIRVETKNIDLNQLYTGSFSNTNTQLALQSITAPSRIKFKFEGSKVLFYAKTPQ
jgi:ferric-dicitrate binding protein FerR (iron transport regulator)